MPIGADMGVRGKPNGFLEEKEMVHKKPPSKTYYGKNGKSRKEFLRCIIKKR